MKTREIDAYCKKVIDLFYKKYTNQLQMSYGEPRGDKYVVCFRHTTQDECICVYLDEQGKLQVYENPSDYSSFR